MPNERNEHTQFIGLSTHSPPHALCPLKKSPFKFLCLFSQHSTIRRLPASRISTKMNEAQEWKINKHSKLHISDEAVIQELYEVALR